MQAFTYIATCSDYIVIVWPVCEHMLLLLIYSDVWNIGSYLSEVEQKRVQLITNLSLQQQKVTSTVYEVFILYTGNITV